METVSRHGRKCQRKRSSRLHNRASQVIVTGTGTGIAEVAIAVIESAHNISTTTPKTPMVKPMDVAQEVVITAGVMDQILEGSVVRILTRITSTTKIRTPATTKTTVHTPPTHHPYHTHLEHMVLHTGTNILIHNRRIRNRKILHSLLTWTMPRQHLALMRCSRGRLLGIMTMTRHCLATARPMERLTPGMTRQ